MRWWRAAVCLCVCLRVSLSVATAPLKYVVESTLEENDECDRKGSHVWRCRKAQDCPALRKMIQSGDSPRNCFWRKEEPFVCCPAESPVTKYVDVDSISQIKCDEYLDHLCPKGPSAVGPFVFGGRRAAARRYPHMVSIGYGEEGSINWHCGGSLISDSYVLSAAHCSNTSYGLATWARLGDLDISTDTDDARPQQLRIVQRLVHAEYRPSAYYNDIALFRLERPVEFNVYVKPVCLHHEVVSEGRVIATGWGKNETYGPKSKALMEVLLSIKSDDECKSAVGVVPQRLDLGLDTRIMMCAGDPGKDTCQGDSGGPLVLHSQLVKKSGYCLDHLVGVTSFGPKHCGEGHATGVYVKVAPYLPWIESIAWPSTSSIF